MCNIISKKRVNNQWFFFNFAGCAAWQHRSNGKFDFAYSLTTEVVAAEGWENPNLTF